MPSFPRREMTVNPSATAARSPTLWSKWWCVWITCVTRLPGTSALTTLRIACSAASVRLASTMVRWSSNSKNVLPFRNHTWSATFIGFRLALPPAGAPCGDPAERTDAGALRSSIGGIDDVAIDVELALHDVAEVDRGGEAGRQLNALLRHVAGECGSIRDVTKVGVRADVADPGGEIRCSIHGQRQRVALAHGDVDQLQARPVSGGSTACSSDRARPVRS